MEEIKITEPEHPTRLSRVVNILIGLALVAVAASVAIFLIWSFARTDVLVINNNPFPARLVKDGTGKTGGIVFLETDYCKNVDVVGKLRMSYVSETTEDLLPVTDEKLPVGCNKTNVPVVIPVKLIPGTYKIKFRVSYDVNPIRQSIVNEFESQPFTLDGARSE